MDYDFKIDGYAFRLRAKGWPDKKDKAQVRACLAAQEAVHRCLRDIWSRRAVIKAYLALDAEIDHLPMRKLLARAVTRFAPTIEGAKFSIHPMGCPKND